MRATWRPDRGFVNLSLWRDQSCVETFHLSPVDAGQLIGFLAGALMTAVPGPRSRHLRVASDTSSAVTARQGSTGAWRRRFASHLESVARRLRN